MALTKTIEVDKIEVVGTHKHVQVRTATIISEDGTEISRSYHRHVIAPGTVTADEDDQVRSICNLIHTEEVVNAYQASLSTED